MAFPWLHKVTWTLSVRLLHMDTGRVGTSLVAYFKWLFLAWESGLSSWVKILHEQLTMSPTGQRCKAFCWHVNLTSWWYKLLFTIRLKKKGRGLSMVCCNVLSVKRELVWWQEGMPKPFLLNFLLTYSWGLGWIVSVLLQPSLLWSRVSASAFTVKSCVP